MKGLALLSILFAVLLAACGDEPGSVPGATKAQLDEAQGRCMALYYTARTWKQANGRMPRTLGEAMPPATEDAPRAVQLDPWGRAYEVRAIDAKLHVASRGPDGRPGTADDIVYPLP